MSLDLMKMEWQNLREEQEFLKGCQLRYFVLSITVVGVFVGLVRVGQGDIGKTLENYPWVFLSPLLVTIPSWWVYFDKSKTIARIVGYLRILEELMNSADPKVQKQFLGWERSLGQFREAYSEGNLRRNDNIYHFSVLKQLCLIISLRSVHKYWTMHFYFFSIISFACLLMASGTKDQAPALYWSAVLIFAVTVIYTFRLLVKLIYGRNSYDAHQQAWRQLLGLSANRP